MKKLLLLFLICSAAKAQTIYFAGGEDVDFPNGTTSACSVNGPGPFSSNRVGYARGVVDLCSGTVGVYAASLSFSSVTSAWLHFWYWGCGSWYIGLGTSGKSVGFSNNNSCEAWLGTYDGSSTYNWLVNTSGNVIPSGGSPSQWDLQVSDYGSSCVLNLYMNAASSPTLTYSGNCTVGGNTGLNSVIITFPNSGTSAYYNEGFSEIIVANSDTRALSLVTLTPNANGTTQSWSTPAYTNINPITINDSNFTSDNNNGDVTQYKMNCLPSGTFSIKDVRIITRGLKVSGGLTHINSGFYNGSSDQLGTSAAQNSYFFPFLNDFTTNPFTSSAWQQSDIGCSSSSTTLQLELKSGT